METPNVSTPEAEESKTGLVKDAIQKGFILACVHVVVYVLVFYLVPSKITGFTYLFFVLGLNMGYTIYYSVQFRKELGGYISFGTVFKYTFLILAFNSLISSVIFPMIHRMVETNYMEIYAQSQADTSVYWAQKFGAPDAALEQVREKTTVEEMEKQFAPGRQAIGIIVVLAMEALGAVIVAFIARKQEEIS